MKTKKLFQLMIILSVSVCSFISCDKDSTTKETSYPDTINTGPQGKLSTYTGSTNFSYDNVVVQNVIMDINDALYINAKNITLRNVRIIYSGDVDATWTMLHTTELTENLLIEDCEFDGQDKVARAISGEATNLIIRRCNIHNTGNGIEINDSFTVEDCYIHDIFTPEGLDWHSDGIQAGGGTISNITIRHNTILLTGDETGCVNINGGNDSATANVRNILVEDNLIGGGGYTMYTGSHGELSNYRVINNKFTTSMHPKVGYYNIWYEFKHNPEKSGNTIFETGESAEENL